LEPTPLRPPNQRRQFLLGLGLGVIPLAVWLIFIGAATADVARCASEQVYCSLPGVGQLLTGLIVFGILWLIQVIVTIATLTNQARRFVGYGLLTMLLIGPIVGSIACIEVPNLAR
jgi:hypothetical protein